MPPGKAVKDKLNTEQREYVLYHLSRHFNLPAFSSFFLFEKNDTRAPFVFFPSSNKPHNENRRIEDIPVLYPLASEDRFFHFDSNNNLIFDHDLLKGAFYLLSGYQEWQTGERDARGRFPFTASIHYRLNIAEMPLVNIYFDIISRALELFAKKHGLVFQKKSFWGNRPFAFFLTHDIDRVDRWIFAEVKRRIKIAQKHRGPRQKLSAIFHELNFFGRNNSFWNFDRMMAVEDALNIKSTWFFLPGGIKHIDAYYDLKEERIKKLARKIADNGHHIGAHGVYNSMTDPAEMRRTLREVRQLSPADVIISRQHWLRFRYPDTLKLLAENRIEMDSSWGFAEHCGWRNSYCHPFHPFDLNQNRMLPILEIPLNAMDVTFMEYMGLDEKGTREHIMKMVHVCKKYGGIFTLLWHNNHLNEEDHPGVWDFYKTILDDIIRENPYIFTPGAMKGLPL